MTYEQSELNLEDLPPLQDPASIARDHASEHIWQNRSVPASVNIRVHCNDQSRDIDNLLEHWCGTGKLTRNESDRAAELLNELRSLLSIPVIR